MGAYGQMGEPTWRPHLIFVESRILEMPKDCFSLSAKQLDDWLTKKTLRRRVHCVARPARD